MSALSALNKYPRCLSSTCLAVCSPCRPDLSSSIYCTPTLIQLPEPDIPFGGIEEKEGRTQEELVGQTLQLITYLISLKYADY